MSFGVILIVRGSIWPLSKHQLVGGIRRVRRRLGHDRTGILPDRRQKNVDQSGSLRPV
jgi:hypothetical protein